jgi:hypothetical protein
MKDIKNLPKIKNWFAFLKHWKRAETETELIGLLYAGASIPLPEDPSLALKDLKDRLDFFLTVAREGSEDLSDTAKQLIVKKILFLFPPLVWEGLTSPDIAKDIFVISLIFLNKSHACLQEPPYPRFIGEYLNFIARNIVPIQEKTGSLYEISFIIKPLIVWGEAKLLTFLSDIEESSIIEHLSEFLKENTKQWWKQGQKDLFVCTLRNLLIKSEECRNLKKQEGRDTVLENACLAFLFYRECSKQ